MCIYSFELKKRIDRSNYRESYFQAVSNSSWANEGYLVASEIIEDDDLMLEFERLNCAFGIGIISLNIYDLHSSKILFHARKNDGLDWETMNKLCKSNTDFEEFINSLNLHFISDKIITKLYDDILKDPDSYIKDKYGMHTKKT